MSIFRLVSVCGTPFNAILGISRCSLKILWMVRFSMPVTQVVSIPICTTLDLQLSFYRPLCCINRAHRPILQCLLSTSAILAGADCYFMISSFKCEEKNSCHDFKPNPWIFDDIGMKLHFYVFYIINYNVLALKVRIITRSKYQWDTVKHKYTHKHTHIYRHTYIHTYIYTYILHTYSFRKYYYGFKLNSL